MAETPTDSRDKKYSRRQVGSAMLKIAASGAAVTTGLIGGAAAEIGVNEASIEFSTRQSEEMLSQRTGLDIKLVFGDHLPPKVEKEHPIYTGEIAAIDLRYDKTYDTSSLPEESTYYEGIEILGRKRLEYFIDKITASKLMISMDGDSIFTQEYLDRVADARDKKTVDSYIASSLAAGLSIATTIKVLDEIDKRLGIEQPSKAMSRREFMNVSAMAFFASTSAMSAYRAVSKTTLDMDLSQMLPVWRNMYSVFPHEDTIHMRNLSMVNSINSLGAFDLSNFDSEITVFAGSGHLDMNKLIESPPEDVNNKLRSMITDKYRMLNEAYENANVDEKDVILEVGFAMAKNFLPAFARINHDNVSDDQREIKFTDKEKVVDSSGLVFVDSLNDLIEEDFSLRGGYGGFYLELAYKYQGLIQDNKYIHSTDGNYSLEIPGKNQEPDSAFSIARMWNAKSYNGHLLDMEWY